SYNSLDGIPSTCNDYLLTDVLHNQWNFRGFVVSDLYSINGMWHTHHVTNTLDEAGVMALKAGVDADLGALAYENLEKALNNGDITIDDIDRACGRILRMKFEMGLFENPYVDAKKAKKEVRSEAHRQVALQAARASVTMLKNDNNTLPLAKTAHVAVIGPNADNRYNQLGDYTSPQDDGNVKTVLDGIRQKIGTANVEYVKGCAVRDTTESDIKAAVKAAERADVVVVCVGGSSARDFKTSYKDTGAAVADASVVSDMDCGEGFDRATLSLLGDQQRLLECLKATGKPMIVVYIEGRPLDKTWAADNADALLTAYYPGQEGGTAIADVLFGDYNPAGRLPVSVPADIGQIPVYYNKKAPLVHDYVEMSALPLYSFGFGLSYTTFDYSDMKITETGNGWMVECNVTNTGNYDGEEVVQLYIHDEVASTVQPLKQLKHFARKMIRKGESERFCFMLTKDDLCIVDRNMNRVVEPGDFKIMIGSSSDNIRLETMMTVK
ncbi:MAG: glycoside hydrolase family 3 C-terminal domain-containing protein, partial [Prevotella sp.]|nr:glycoside hydrolase family 3 C-terminal domain-containing protein [Prevotella sp.]